MAIESRTVVPLGSIAMERSTRDPFHVLEMSYILDLASSKTCVYIFKHSRKQTLEITAFYALS